MERENLLAGPPATYLPENEEAAGALRAGAPPAEVAAHMFTHYDGVLKIDGEVGDKKTYDPRSWGKAGEANMAARVVEACEDLQAVGKRLT